MLKYRVFFLYSRRRVQCPYCGVKAEFLPWADGKHQLTTFYMKHLADWCRCLSWKETAYKFQTSWYKVFESVRWVVEWGLKQRSLEGITAIEVDEIQWKKGHKYLTLVYQINPGCVRLLWMGLERTEFSFNEFFDVLAERAKKAYSSGIVEGLNNKVKLTMRKSYGFRTFKAIEIALYHSLGKLPEPPLITHRFF